MASGKEIKRKISSVKNIGKITKAMELISTVKMKRAQDAVTSKKEYMMALLKVFLKVQDKFPESIYFSPETKEEKTLAIVVTSNKGFCGGYNVNILKEVSHYLKNNSSENIDFVAVGKRGSRFIAKTGNNLIADFSDKYTDSIDSSFSREISSFVNSEYISGKYSKVVFFYSHFVNTIKQIPIAREFLPISVESIKTYMVKVLGEEVVSQISTGTDLEYIIEPSPKEILEQVIPVILQAMIFDIFLEAKASEHSSRMIAMKNAKDSAKKIQKNLTTVYNKARQAMITKEVSEITSGVEALKDL